MEEIILELNGCDGIRCARAKQCFAYTSSTDDWKKFVKADKRRKYRHNCFISQCVGKSAVKRYNMLAKLVDSAIDTTNG